MWRRVSCEQQLHSSQSILSTRRNPMLMAEDLFLNSKFISSHLCERESGSYSRTWSRNRITSRAFMSK
jgi:hypothetical protein